MTRYTRFTLAALLALTLTVPAAAQEFLLVVKNGRSQLYRVDAANVLVPVQVKVVNMDGTDPTPPVDPPTDGSLQEWVKARLALVPQHDRRDESRLALAGIYQVLADQWKTGAVNASNLKAVRTQAVDGVLTTLRTKDAWTKFNQDLEAEVNRRKPTASTMAQVLEDVSQGLTEGKALSPELIPAVIEVVQAIISGEGVLTAIIKLVAILLQGIGEGV